MNRWYRSGCAAFALLALSSCVTTPENTYSQAEIDLLRESTGHTELEVATDPDLIAHIDEAVATPVDFHALIVDKAGNPIPDFPVQITLYDQKLSPLAWPYLGWTTYSGLVTDKAGRVSLTGKTGARLAISVHNQDYWELEQKSSRAVFNYADVARSSGDGPLPTTPETAVTFRLQKVPDEAIASPLDMGSVRLRPGEEIGLSLYLPRYAVDPANADFFVQLDRQLPDESGRYDWQLRVRAPGGGVQLAPSLYIESAPELGYEESLELGHRADSDSWRDQTEALLFLRTPRGHYAFLELKIRTSGEPFIAVTGRVNDFGLRYLE